MDRPSPSVDQARVGRIRRVVERASPTSRNRARPASTGCRAEDGLEYAKSFDRERARALSNPELAPHLEFVDLGGHGYAKVRLTGDEMRTEFVCIPRPITRSAAPDGGPLRYRVVHTAKLWEPGERPRLERQVLEGDPGLSI